MKPINHIQNAIAYIDSEIVNLAVPTDRRTAIFVTLSDVSLEHCKGIFTLINFDMYSSAYALVRPMYETGVRSLWFRHCATCEEVNRFAEKDKINNTSLKSMVEAVELEIDIEGALSKIHELAGKAMNSYVHGGLMQSSKRLETGNVSAKWNDTAEHEVCKLLAIMMLILYTEIVSVAQCVDAESQIQKLSELIDDVLVPANSK